MLLKMVFDQEARIWDGSQKKGKRGKSPGVSRALAERCLLGARVEVSGNPAVSDLVDCSVRTLAVVAYAIMAVWKPGRRRFRRGRGCAGNRGL